MAVKRYDGSQWVTVAGKGDQGTSSSIATWVKTASGGETSLSGNDDNSQPLSYTVGQELVFINGALQKRGSDYTATTGNSITGLTALAANDVVTVWTVNAFSVTDAIANSLVDAKGDLIVATGADTPGRLAVGSANQVLTVDSSTGTGLKWATPAAGGKVLQVVSNTNNTEVVIQTGTYTDTGVTATITPTLSTSKILVIASCNFGIQNSSVTDIWADFKLLRGATTIQTWGDNAGGGMFMRIGGASGTLRLVGNYSVTYLDSPSTTSSTTYKIQGSRQGTADIYCQRGNCAPSTLTLLEIGV